MSIVRKRSAANKSYIPANARDNQYLLAEITITDELIKTVAPNLKENSPQAYFNFYQNLSLLLSTLCNDFKIESSIFVANDKLVRVRYSQEMHQWQTNQQILFYYDPSIHKLQNSVFDSNIRAKKLNLLFLATGDDLRSNAAKFHNKVNLVLKAYCKQIALQPELVRLRDHQHLTYDLFAKNKGCLGTNAHKLRTIRDRYTNQKVALPNDISAITYAVVSLPINNHILSLVDIDSESSDPYNPLYTYLTDTFSLVAKRYNLNNGALIANGLIPIVRHSEFEAVMSQGELQMLGYNPNQSSCGIVSKWQANQLADSVYLIFVATKDNKTDSGYGRFLNQIEQALRLMSTELELTSSKDELTIRFHQHIAYNLTNE